MSKNITHEEIAQRFVNSKAFDFQNIGKILSELGPTLAVNDDGLHGVVFGRFNMIACMLTAGDAKNLVGNLRGSGVVSTMMEDAFRGK